MTSKSEQFRLNVQRGGKENENTILAHYLAEELYGAYYIECINKQEIEDSIKIYLDKYKEV